MPMTTPTANDGNGTTPVDGTTMDDPRHDELLRQAIQKKLASLSPEEGRRWLESMLTRLTRTEIVRIQKPGDAAPASLRCARLTASPCVRVGCSLFLPEPQTHAVLPLPGYRCECL